MTEPDEDNSVGAPMAGMIRAMWRPDDKEVGPLSQQVLPPLVLPTIRKNDMVRTIDLTKTALVTAVEHAWIDGPALIVGYDWLTEGEDE